MTKRVTIKDLARELDIHHSTVSRALHNDPRVHINTQKTVAEAARRHGYQVNMNALHLRGNSNNTIALIVPNIRHTFFTNVVSNLTHLAHREGFVISVFESNEDTRQERESIHTIIRHNFAGVIASIAKDTRDGEHFKWLGKYGIPLVFFDRVCEDIDVPKVLINNYESAFEATNLLIDKGYRQIAHVTGPVHLNVFRDRQKGYTRAMEENNLAYRNEVIIDKELVVEEGKKAFFQLMAQNKKPDAILSSSSLVSIGIIVQARDLGFSIPEDIALISFGDNPFMEVMEPGITSIIQSDDAVAESCFDLILKMINREGGVNGSTKKTIATKMICRQSTI